MPPSPAAEAKREDRHTRILAAARHIAEAEGWPAVTVRRLADEIGYSQPVLYTHFENRDSIVTAVAVEGFHELGLALAAARSRKHPLLAAASAYLAFATDHPALYQAMFNGTLGVPFADPATPPELRFAFAQLLALFPRSSPPATSSHSTATRAELLWASLHGIAELSRTGRLPPGAQRRRLTLLVSLFAPAPA